MRDPHGARSLEDVEGLAEAALPTSTGGSSEQPCPGPDLPPLLQEIVNRALQKELPQRYRRAGELAQDLRACLHSLAA